jgi:hypothetical protein
METDNEVNIAILLYGCWKYRGKMIRREGVEEEDIERHKIR